MRSKIAFDVDVNELHLKTTSGQYVTREAIDTSRRTKAKSAKKGVGKKERGKKVNILEKDEKDEKKNKDKGKKESNRSKEQGRNPVLSPVAAPATANTVFPTEAPVVTAPIVLQPSQTVNLFTPTGPSSGGGAQENGEEVEKDSPNHLEDDEKYSGESSTVEGTEQDNSLSSEPETEPSDTSNDLYNIITCGSVPEEIVEFQISYLYDLRVDAELEARDVIRAVEKEMLDSMKENFVVCENSSRRRLNSVVGISALPEDKFSGTCGDNCISVNGGVTFYLNEESEMRQNRCDVRSNMLNVFDKIESDNDKMASIDIVETDFLECELSTVDLTREGGIEQANEMDNAENGLPSAAVGIIAVASVITVALALFLTRRTTRRNAASSDVNMDSKNDDATSIMTPATGGSKCGSLSPARSTQSYPSVSTVDSKDSSDKAASSIAQFIPESIDEEMLTSVQEQSNMIYSSTIPSCVAGEISGVVTTISKNCSVPEMGHMNSLEDSPIESEDISEMLQRWKHGVTENDDTIEVVQESTTEGEEESDLTLPVIPESDDESTDTTAVSNVSPKSSKQNRKDIQIEKTNEGDDYSACTAVISNVSPESLNEKKSVDNLTESPQRKQAKEER
mmetsp:Transcript_10858/g.16005  ORF Transcript_10858/g.16005 Transcript_10858/m.16005 type:complete len:622 (-) Transcript_10858:105-1970(-)